MLTGVALSGGGIGGTAHAGVLKALTEQSVKIDMISGTSLGAITASLYAAGFSPSSIEAFFVQTAAMLSGTGGLFLLLKEFIPKKGHIPLGGLFDGRFLENKLKQMFKSKNICTFKDFEMPVAVTALDVTNGEMMIFTSKRDAFLNGKGYKAADNIPVWTGIRAAVTLPALLRPLIVKGKIYISSESISPLPSFPLWCMGADKVLSACVSSVSYSKKGATLPELTEKTISNLSKRALEAESQVVDCNVTVDLDKLNKKGLKGIEAYIKEGYNTINKEVEKILTSLYLTDYNYK